MVIRLALKFRYDVVPREQGVWNGVSFTNACYMYDILYYNHDDH